MMDDQQKTILLAFSGGLDTTYCAALFVKQNHIVHTVTVDTGGFSAQDLYDIQQRALQCGVTSHTVLDRTKKLYNDVLRHCIAGNVLKNATYPLSVSAERVVQAIAIAEHAKTIGATHVAHGSTGAGNDQIRFDVVFHALCPDVPVITPIRENKLSRAEEIAFVQSCGIDGSWERADYSINQGLWGTTIGGRETLTSDKPLPEEAFPSSKYVVNENAREALSIGFSSGQPSMVNGQRLDHVELIRLLNELGAKFHIGRDMHVGDTIIGIKGRVAFEAPAAMLLIKAHHALEKHVLSKWQLVVKDQISATYGQLLHEGQFLDPVMRSIESFFDKTQERVTGVVEVELKNERFQILGIQSEHDLMRSSVASYGETSDAWTAEEARGFARIAAIPTMLTVEEHGA